MACNGLALKDGKTRVGPTILRYMLIVVSSMSILYGIIVRVFVFLLNKYTIIVREIKRDHQNRKDRYDPHF